MAPLIRECNTKPPKHAVEILAPCNRNGRSANGILQPEVPADNPGNELSHGRVGIRISAARNWNHRSEFRIAQSREGTADTRNNKCQGDRGARPVGNRSGGSHKQTSADNSADSEHYQIHGAERPLKAMLACLLS